VAVLAGVGVSVVGGGDGREETPTGGGDGLEAPPTGGGDGLKELPTGGWDGLDETPTGSGDGLDEALKGGSGVSTNEALAAPSEAAQAKSARLRQVV
jgi:hypothetical protein